MKIMQWGELGQMLSGHAEPRGCFIQQLAREDIPQLTEHLRDWYPDIQVGTESRHLEPTFYEREFFLRGESPDRSLYAMLCRSQERNEIIGLLTLEKNVRGLQISAPMGAIKPSHRAMGIGQLGVTVLEAVGRSIGAEVALYYSTLKLARAQLNAEHHGFKLVGIVPAFDMDAIAPGTVKRVYEAIYAKVLTGPEHVHIPDWNALIPSTRALFTHLFGAHPIHLANAPVQEQKHG
ncbi:hypothetical protein OV208_16320 [Corallococcus sp. bb12-1]|uniref:hypothetical protein n=1 Tax=Corallococcus sp. bb12-1 TaxID=2996784 RepID=UPI00226F5FBF|nr:hypothetical protein [Corallococcus sp. bb12-1]MCY1042886.1 hypothetical protein [Corallococcus sp. bb12-1]